LRSEGINFRDFFLGAVFLAAVGSFWMLFAPRIDGSQFIGLSIACLVFWLFLFVTACRRFKWKALWIAPTVLPLLALPALLALVVIGCSINTKNCP
jgi:hypothetical protein